MEEVINFFGAFRKIKLTLVSGTILCVPLLLIFITLNLLIFVFDEQTGSVVANDAACAKIGKRMLVQGGTVVDAAIATMMCEGVVLPNRAGLGGGFTAILYMSGVVETVTATPLVPKFYNHTYLDSDEDIEGVLAGGVPGELLGYWEMHQKYGLLPWRYLLQPTIKLCEEGIPVTEWLQLDIHRSASFLYKSAGMRQLYATMTANREGRIFKFKALANTLRRIAAHGPKVFYEGDIGEAFVEDIQAAGGVLTMEDLGSYKVSWSRRPVVFTLPGGKRGFTTGLPSMGAVVAMVMNIMKSGTEVNTPVFWHRTVEAMKHAFGLSYSLADIENELDEDIVKTVRETFEEMTDMDFAFRMRSKIKDDSISNVSGYYGVKHQATRQAGTSNICLISPSGQAIVLSSSLMWDFGSFGWSPRTGIILNTQLRSFRSRAAHPESLPRSPAQLLRPGKRAVTAHAPTIVLQRESAAVYFIVGAAGSELIPSQVITALLDYCIIGSNAYNASNSIFFQPDATSSNVLVSDAVGSAIVGGVVTDYLRAVGHNLFINIKGNPYAIRTCIAHEPVKPDIQFTYHELGGREEIRPAQGFNSFMVIIFGGLSLWILATLAYELVLLENMKIASYKLQQLQKQSNKNKS